MGLEDNIYAIWRTPGGLMLKGPETEAPFSQIRPSSHSAGVLIGALCAKKNGLAYHAYTFLHAPQGQAFREYLAEHLPEYNLTARAMRRLAQSPTFGDYIREHHAIDLASGYRNPLCPTCHPREP